MCSANRKLVEPRFVVRLMFEWGGGCLWSGSAATREAFGVGPIEKWLPLSLETRRRLEQLSHWHDGALDWDYPPNLSPWALKEREQFESAAAELLAIVQMELGSAFEVVYVPL